MGCRAIGLCFAFWVLSVSVFDEKRMKNYYQLLLLFVAVAARSSSRRRRFCVVNLFRNIKNLHSMKGILTDVFNNRRRRTSFGRYFIFNWSFIRRNLVNNKSSIVGVTKTPSFVQLKREWKNSFALRRAFREKKFSTQKLFQLFTFLAFFKRARFVWFSYSFSSRTRIIRSKICYQLIYTFFVLDWRIFCFFFLDS